MKNDLTDDERADFEPQRETPTCECGLAVESRGDTCQDCIELHRELEVDAVWEAWTSGLKGGAAEMDALYGKLAGWKYMDAKIEHERTSAGLSIAKADDLHFLAPGHRGHLLFARDEETGWPIAGVVAGTDTNHPDWTATFTAYTPHNLILAACNAVIHHN